MSSNPLEIPVGPDGIRIFSGFRLPTLTKERFFTELGEVFMPGTPYMQAELGLSSYNPAVLDSEGDPELPDEVALIVYASRVKYDTTRMTLRRRMYTHSHAGVFDMARSLGQFPGTVEAPERPTERVSWRLFESQVDWQYGEMRVLFYSQTPGKPTFADEVIATTAAAKADLTAAGADQVICLAAPRYAVIWIHGPSNVSIGPEKLVPAGAQLLRDLAAQPVPMPTLSEGPKITGASAFTFRFVRDLRHFL
jgi:hypothetical protein